MSLKKIEQVKSRKWFSIFDIIAYAVIALSVVALILAFTLTKNTTALDGFYVTYKGEKVFVCDFAKDSYSVLSQSNIEVLEDDADKLVIRFYTDGGKGYNDISADRKSRKVKVTAGNCSAHKDCVYTAALENNSSVPIVCTPHSLTVNPLNFYDEGIIKT